MAHKAGETVFHYGDQGDLFYIILDGKVEVRIVAPVELDGEDTTPCGLMSFLANFFQDIYWQKVSEEHAVRELFENEMHRLKVNYDDDGNFDNLRMLDLLEREMAAETTKVHYNIHRILNPGRKRAIHLHWFKTVATLNAGQSFGELALLKNDQGRAATIACATKCSFATLSRSDYRRVIGQEEKK